MSDNLLYMPVFRCRTEEKKVFLSRTFHGRVYPCIEIIKYSPQKPREFIADPKKPDKKPKKPAEFQEVYLPMLKNIQAERVFVDLPVHLKQPRNMKPEVLKFMKEVVEHREVRTEFMLKLASLSEKIIPVISTYFHIANEKNTIRLQEADLRKTFRTLAFRTFPHSFDRDFAQIQDVIQVGDYLIFDIDDAVIDIEDPDVFQPRLAALHEKVGCQIVIVRNIVSCSIKNNEMVHGALIEEITNDVKDYKLLNGTSFGDYAGIKKDPITKGGGISPGFIFYDPTKSGYYGYRGNVHEIAGKKTGLLDDFERIIIPDVLKSASVLRMRISRHPYITDRNLGWSIMQSIELGRESGKSQAKFKRISMEHYIHCIETDIAAGKFD